MSDSLSQKVVKYEQFLNERLRSDLKVVLRKRDAILEDLSEYSQLKNTIELLQTQKSQNTPLKSMIDLGCNFYSSAKIPDCSKIFVCVGLGFVLEMTLDEALVFIDKKTSKLSKKVEILSEQASEISARIKVVLEGLNELQFSEQAQFKEHSPRVVW